ncbi:CehA/McbA family metallohydrolase [Marinobacter sp. JSM 1782161]|uniref:CehA/McbA family metallohydrolase n=1 Tax=Marinobacter sp. JSM 1782161 TaxID=2685906 RepID=UPI001402EB62|nr:CehA/McbA family metallohydrolase [Marinobacter sp. JSM 1782161]
MSTARLTAFALLGLALGAGQASADVSVERGATPLVNGDAQSAEDITLRNDRLVASIAVKTPPPWGVAPGGIIDAAPVIDGKPARDKVSLIDFIPNNWSSWPTTYQRFRIVEDDSDRAVVRVERDWEGVELVTVYSLEEGSDQIHVVTEMTNHSKKHYKDILSGYVMWPDGGHLFGPPGMHGTEEGPTDKAVANWSAAYDENWGFVLHAPYMNYIDYDARDLYEQQDLAPKASRIFEAWIQVLPDGSIARAVDSDIERLGMESGHLSGSVQTPDGESVDKPVVVVERDGEPYTWVVGQDGAYDLNLPTGQYELYATGRSYADSEPVSVTVTADSDRTIDFDDVRAPGKVHFKVVDEDSEEPRDARLTIREGQTPLVGFLGQTTYFTELDTVGEREIAIAPGDYEFDVSYGENFLSRATRVDVDVDAGETTTEEVEVEQVAFPNQHGWYAADMHHHSDVLDGFTPPEFAIRSQLAAGLDLTLLLDHDTTRNLPEAAKLSAGRDVPFIPSIEISPSWGHFNPYPIDPDANYTLNSGEASVQDIMEQTQALGGEAIQMNHPYIKYGYYTNVENGTATGGYFPRFDLMEINAEGEYEKTLRKAWDHWSHGERIYLSAGSDVHDVWKHRSGAVRAYAKVSGHLDAPSFVTALRDGHAFVTFGPMVYPDQVFGDDLNMKLGDSTTLGFDLEAANGLKSIQLIGQDGQVVDQRSFDEDDVKGRAEFEITAYEDTFYAVVVEDAEGKKAFSNPIWINAMEHRPAPADPEAAEDEDASAES